jgi:hypothetical protein
MARITELILQKKTYVVHEVPLYDFKAGVSNRSCRDKWNKKKSFYPVHFLLLLLEFLKYYMKVS